METMVRTEKLSVSYRTGKSKYLKALSDVDLAVEKGDFLALLGPNGAGKTTAMLCMLGLIKPTTGSVSLLGSSPYPGAPVFERVAYLPEEPLYPEFLNIRETVTYYSGLYKNDCNEKKIRELIGRVGLTDFEKLKVGQCSKGMKQRLGIAICLANDPEVYFLDELSRGLDPIMLMDLRDILLELSSEGKTIIMNSHMLSEVEQLCTKAVIINKGRVIRQDTLDNLMSTDIERYTAEIGSCEVPEFAELVSRVQNRLILEFETSRLPQIAEYCRSRNVVLYECHLKRRSLEDAFRQVLGEDK
ncbi:MAG: ABC transporter ATP-binding protein [Candidatus Wallbacteria bacterium]|nr:ABC transporter ATP-binding protein [Candidatus Wallbacteria bacterium]